MVIFTSICANYLHKARVLGRSVKQNIPDATFVVCMTEREKTPAMEYEAFDSVVLSKDMWEGNFEQFIFQHAIVEASTAVKGRFFQYLYKAYPNEDQFVYLDPDCRVYGDFTELRELLREHPIVVCPHVLEPGNIDMEISSMAHGVYNLGFLGVNRTEEARKMIDWWAARLDNYCYDDIPNGIFTDQKWIDLAPCFFDTYICKHHGYDFATWRMKDSGLERREDGWYLQGEPLRFVHFSGYGALMEQCMRNWLPEGEKEYHTLYAEYCAEHEAANADGVSKTPWTYDRYLSGETIRTDIRTAYRKTNEVRWAYPDPFTYSNMFFNLRLNVYPISFSDKLHIWSDGCRRALAAEGFGGMVRKICARLKAKLFH